MTMTVHPDVSEVLYDAASIEKKTAELAARITRDYEGKNLTVLALLKGSFMFLADLVRKIDLDLAVEFMSASSYGAGTVSGSEVNIRLDIAPDLAGRHILIAEDILDTGNTLRRVRDLLISRNPDSLSICTLLDKPSRRRAPVSADYTGFTVPDEFLVGYGLDYAEKYRNLPYIGVLKREIYDKIDLCPLPVKTVASQGKDMV